MHFRKQNQPNWVEWWVVYFYSALVSGKMEGDSICLWNPLTLWILSSPRKMDLWNAQCRRSAQPGSAARKKPGSKIKYFRILNWTFCNNTIILWVYKVHQLGWITVNIRHHYESRDRLLNLHIVRQYLQLTDRFLIY